MTGNDHRRRTRCIACISAKPPRRSIEGGGAAFCQLKLGKLLPLGVPAYSTMQAHDPSQQFIGSA
jgi:hypothetical protein